AAITQLAVYDAVNSILRTHEPYLARIPTPPDALPEAAVVAAAHRALATLYPARAPELDAVRATSLASIPNGPAKDHGIAVGMAAADALLAHRAHDGSGNPGSYLPGSGPGAWEPTPPA